MITPGVIATDNLSAINLVARGYDPDVTSDGIPDEINVKAQTPKVRNIAAADKNSVVTIDSDLIIDKMGKLKEILMLTKSHLLLISLLEEKLHLMVTWYLQTQTLRVWLLFLI